MLAQLVAAGQAQAVGGGAGSANSSHDRAQRTHRDSRRRSSVASHTSSPAPTAVRAYRRGSNASNASTATSGTRFSTLNRASTSSSKWAQYDKRTRSQGSSKRFAASLSAVGAGAGAGAGIGAAIRNMASHPPIIAEPLVGIGAVPATGGGGAVRPLDSMSLDSPTPPPVRASMRDEDDYDIDTIPSLGGGVFTNLRTQLESAEDSKEAAGDDDDDNSNNAAARTALARNASSGSTALQTIAYLVQGEPGVAGPAPAADSDDTSVPNPHDDNSGAGAGAGVTTTQRTKPTPLVTSAFATSDAPPAPLTGLKAAAGAVRRLGAAQRGARFKRRMFGYSHRSLTPEGRVKSDVPREPATCKNMGCMRGCILSPDGRFLRWWDVAFVFFLVWIAFRVPFVVAFHAQSQLGLSIVDWISEASFFLDIALTFVTAFVHRGVLVDDPCDIATHYLRTWFFVDLVASLPFTLILGSQSVWRLLKLLRLLRLRKVDRVEHKLIRTLDLNPTAQVGVRLVKLFAAMVFSGHIGACIWFTIAETQGHGPDSWTNTYSNAGESTMQLYGSACYWAFATLTTVGYGDVSAHTDVERLFSLAMLLVGAGFFATLVGRMSALSTMINQDRQAMSRRWNQVNQWLKMRGVDDGVRHRARDYYDYLAHAQPFMNEEAMLADLPPPLRRTVAMHLNDMMLNDVPILQSSDHSFKAALVGVLRATVVLPGEYIVVLGDVGTEMYIVRSGDVRVVDSSGMVLHMLSSGSFFGEEALLYRERAAHSIRAASHCELYRLTRGAFSLLIEDFPEFEATLRTAAVKRRAHERDLQRKAALRARQRKQREEEIAAAAEQAQAEAEAAAVKHSTASLASPPRKLMNMASHWAGSLKDMASFRTTRKSDTVAFPPSERPQTPPFGKSWAQVREYVQGFKNFKGTGGARSRVMNAVEYLPNPESWEHISIPQDMDTLLDALTVNLHEVWARDKRATGWMWGHARDTDLRHHPQLRPFATLAPVDQMFNRQLTTGIVKHVLGRGFSFLPLGSGEELTLWSMRTDMSADEFNSVRDDLEATDISPDSQVARRRLNAAYTPQPYPTQHVQLPAATLELVDDVSSNLHELWSAERMRSGWSWGPEVNAGTKTHCSLVPYDSLTEDEKNVDRRAVIGTLKMVSALGFVLVLGAPPPPTAITPSTAQRLVRGGLPRLKPLGQGATAAAAAAGAAGGAVTGSVNVDQSNVGDVDDIVDDRDREA